LLCIWNQSTDPAFNLALEEYCLTQRPEDFFLLWRNRSAVIIGRNQNARAEIDREFVEREGIAVVRRLSGGGAVFHDLGNINFTFISSLKTGQDIDFVPFAQPVIKALRQMGVPVDFDGRNDLVVNGAKVSGNAQFIYKNRVLHHGTLLYDSNTEQLAQALRTDALKFQTKAVKSVRKRVANIIDSLPEPISTERFIGQLLEYFLEYYPDAQPSALVEADKLAIASLREQKYSSWDWNFGAAPFYNQRYALRTAKGGTLEIALEIRKGKIDFVRIWGDYFGVRDVSGLESQLLGTTHEREALRRAIAGAGLNGYLWNVQPEELLTVLMGEAPAIAR
jgi:lipoate-protein ligase A